MNKQSVYNENGFGKIFSLFLLMSLPVLSICLFSCNSDEATNDRKQREGRGFVSLKLKSDTTFVATKASPGPERPDDYLIQILQGEQLITSFPFADMPESISLDAGDYTAKASWGTQVPAAFESLYMEGSTDFSIKDGETEQISIGCVPANAKVTVDYTSELKQVYSDYSVSMHTRHTGSSSLKFEKNESRSGYFQADPKGETLNMDMNFVANGQDYKFTNSLTIQPRDFIRLHLGLSDSGGSDGPDPDPSPSPNPNPNPDPSPDPTPDITENPTISVGIAGIMLPADGKKKEEIPVTSNSDWTIGNPEKWLKAEKNGNKVIFTADPNTSDEGRSATVTLTAMQGNKTASVSIFVVQLPTAPDASSPSISVNIIGLSLPAGGFTQEIMVTSSHDWTLKTDTEGSWISVVQGTDKLTLSAGANTTGFPREGTITLTTQSEGRTASINIQVEQAAREDDPVIAVDFSALTFSGRIDFEMPVSVNQDAWTVQSTATWLTATKNSSGNVYLQADALATGEAPREATIRLTATKGDRTITVDIKIKQNPSVPVSLPSSIRVTIEINETFVKDTILTKLLDIPAGVDKPLTVTSVGFTSGNLLSFRKGEAPQTLYVNIAAYGKIADCQWEDMMNFQTVALTTASPEEKNQLQAAGLFWDSNMKGQKYSTIYLDRFVNNLSEGNHSYQLHVTDEVGQKQAITLKIQITK